MTPFAAGATGAAMLIATTAQAHDWLHGLQHPVTGATCCNDRDCKPRASCTTLDGKGGLIIEENERRCLPIDEMNIVPDKPSPDGRMWGCWWPHDGRERMRCVIPGGTT